MSNLQEKLFQQRMKMILQQSVDSPSNLPGTTAFRSVMDCGVSPMTGLALNLSDASLGMTPSPVQDSKRRLSMDDAVSSSSSPSPTSSLMERSLTDNSCTPLSSISNKPKRLLLGQGMASRLTCLKTITSLDLEVENKENIPLCPPLFKENPSLFSPTKKNISFCSSLFSPTKGRSPLKSRPSPLKRQSSFQPSPSKAGLRGPGVSPLKLGGDTCQGRRSGSIKRPMFTVLEDEDSCSRDSGYNSQSLELGALFEMEDGVQARKKSRTELDVILSNCSPGKEEEGIAPLADSPKENKSPEKVTGRDGFDLPSILEESSESDTDSPKLGFSSLMSNKLILPQHLTSNPAFTGPTHSPEDTTPTFLTKKSLPSLLPSSRPMFRRALSMQEPGPASSCLLSDSPLSRTAGPLQLTGLKPGFKRPEPPGCRQGLDTALGAKKRRFGLSGRQNQDLMEHEEETTRKKPVFSRSHSENELSIMKSCQLKEEVENILPDSSRLYSLPTLSTCTKHPSLRSMTCDTLADLIMGHHSDVVESYRIVDVRYKFEYEGGHIVGAENWQHGEDDLFLAEFVPTKPLTTVPTHNVDNQTKRKILIFHCEFSSQRGPDFYMKLREKDRQLNKDVYPALYYPECYLLHLGYKEFFRKHPSLCTGTYTEMNDPRHEGDLRKMRAKSKSWSGGTVARTSRMGRLHL